VRHGLAIGGISVVETGNCVVEDSQMLKEKLMCGSHTSANGSREK
jgi:hypothetical protein